MENRIAQALNKLFERHRIVFWYDAKQDLHDDFKELELAGVEKIELTNNEFGVKHRILREQPDDKFLISYFKSLPSPKLFSFSGIFPHFFNYLKHIDY